jgi:hypothetical protein
MHGMGDNDEVNETGVLCESILDVLALTPEHGENEPMTAEKLKKWILEFISDIDFEYKGVHGVICPFNEHSFCAGLDGVDKNYDNIDDLMNDKIYFGKSLNEIAGELDI